MKKSIKLISLATSLVLGSLIYCNSGKVNFEKELSNIELKQSPLNISKINLSKDMDIWSVKTDSDLVCFSIIFKNEGSRSFYKTPGLADLVLNTLFEGAGKYDAVGLKKLMSDHSIEIDIGTTRDNLVLTCSCLKKYFDTTMDILSDVLTKAHFNQDKLDIAKQNLTVATKQVLFLPLTKAFEKMTELIYEKDHPYRVFHDQVLKALPGYSRQDVLDCYQKMFATKDAEITIVSNLDNAKIQSAFEKVLKSLFDKKNDFKDVKVQNNVKIKPSTHFVEFDNPHSSILFAMPCVDKYSKEYFALTIANIAFGETGLTSRLAKTVRDNNGLVYRIQSDISSYDLSSHILGIAETRPENVNKVIEIVKTECDKIYKNGITEEELTLAKTKNFSRNIFDSNSSILGFVLKIRGMKISNIEEVNKFLNNYQSLTLNEVNAIIKKVFNPENIMFVYCGKSVAKGDAK